MELNLYQIVMKLNGPIQAVGDSGSDERRLDNLNTLIEFLETILLDVRSASECVESHEHSVKVIGERAKEFLHVLRHSLYDL